MWILMSIAEILSFEKIVEYHTNFTWLIEELWKIYKYIITKQCYLVLYIVLKFNIVLKNSIVEIDCTIKLKNQTASIKSSN